MNKLLVICGPTATGKTTLAVNLASKFNGELISADSRQIYQGLDIGTGKDHPREVVIHMIDLVKPNEPFTVAHYVKLAIKKIKTIWARGRLPVLVGGTGLYIKGIVEGIETIGIPPDWKLRKKLQTWSTPKLQETLKKLAPEKWERMNKSDRENPRRLIRAIETAKQKAKSKKQRYKFKIKNVLFIGLKAANKILYQRIDKRVEERVNQGVVEEIKRLLKRGYSWENSVLGETIGYQEWQPFFEGKITSDEVIKRWKYHEHGYARRQTTWFKKNKRIHWFDITRGNIEKEVVKLVRKWYSKNDA